MNLFSQDLTLLSFPKGMAEGESYPERIMLELKKIEREITAGKFCDNPQALIEKLDNLSRIILKKIDAFRWTITADGQDYKPGNCGCAGCTSITNKPKQSCQHGRNHRLAKKGQTSPIPRRTQPLEIGK